MSPGGKARLVAGAGVAWLGLLACAAAGGRAAETAPAHRPAAPEVHPDGAWPPVGHSVACRDEPLRPGGTRYYFCDCHDRGLPGGADPACQPGSDDHPVNGPSTPWRSWEKARRTFNAMAAGDTVALCRGGAWHHAANATWGNPRCTSERTCDVRDYAPETGDAPPGSHRPEALPRVVSTAPDAKVVLLNSPGMDGHYRFLNLVFAREDALRTTAKAGRAFFMASELRNVLVCNVTVDGFTRAAEALASGARVWNVSDVEFRGCTLSNSHSDAIIWGCDRCGVRDTLFERNGSYDVLTHSIYLADIQIGVRPSTFLAPQGMYLVNNVFHPRGSTAPGRERFCEGTVVVSHTRQEGLLVDHNLIDVPATAVPTARCHGIGISGGGAPSRSWFHHVAIRRNTVIGAGDTPIGISKCSVGCVVENNLVIATPDQQQRGCGARCGGSGITLGWEKGDRKVCNDASPGARGKDPCRDEPNDGVVVRNNTIYHQVGTVSPWGIRVDAEGSRHVLANNAIQLAGGGAGRCYMLQSIAPGAFAYMDHNVCAFASGAWAEITGPGAGTWTTLSAWQSAQGVDARSSQLDPNFAGAPEGDFRPGPGSPLAGAADRGQAPETDLGGRPRASAPDIGALER